MIEFMVELSKLKMFRNHVCKFKSYLKGLILSVVTSTPILSPFHSSCYIYIMKLYLPV